MTYRALQMLMKQLRKIRVTSRYGKLQKLATHRGQLRGAPDVRDGT
jgi:hypothetical protein